MRASVAAVSAGALAVAGVVAYSVTSEPAPSGCGPVTVHGAVAGDEGDDVGAFQSAIDACAGAGGGTVLVPNGRYVIGERVGTYGSLTLATNVQLRGETRAGAVLVQAPGVAASHSLIYTGGGADVSVTDLTLDGNRAAQTADEHRHGLVATGSAHLRVERVTAQGFTGDGFYVSNGVVDAAFRDVRSSDNTRNGLTLGPSAIGLQVRGVSISGSQFLRNGAQQVDSEPGPLARIADVRLSDSLIDPEGASSDYALTISGSNISNKGSEWSVHGNRINGAVVVVWTDDVTLTGNIITNPTTKPAIFIYRASSRVAVVGNQIALTNPSATSEGAVRMAGTAGEGQQPDDVLIAGNGIRTSFASNLGVDMHGGKRAAIVGNSIVGAGVSSGWVGVRVRGSVPVASVLVTGNSIRNFSGGFAVHNPEGVSHVHVAENTFNDRTLVWP